MTQTETADKGEATMTNQELIDAAAAGEKTETRVEIYWDEQDSDNEGPAYRIGDPGSGKQASGALAFMGWNTDEDTEGYSLLSYFDNDCYIGPDRDGVHPTFRIV